MTKIFFFNFSKRTTLTDYADMETLKFAVVYSPDDATTTGRASSFMSLTALTRRFAVIR